MKKIVILFIVLNLSLACTVPSQEENFNSSSLDQPQNNRVAINTNTVVKNYSSNSLVIKYGNWVDSNQKRFLRSYFNVSSYQLCNKCSNTSIELWMFDDNIEIEPKKETINNPAGGFGYPTNPNEREKAIAYVEFNYTMETSSKSRAFKANVNFNSNTNYTNYIKNVNDGLTIAVFDTGINPSLGNAAHFPDKFLYNATSDGIPGLYSGWDFVNNDDNTFDDDPNTHGSAVTSIITRNLNYYNIPYQILPLKVCDSNGMGNYFNLICSLNFALERKASILQMSLGWYNTFENPSNNIFTNLVNQYPNVTLICSAGNDDRNNDLQTHFPSGYPISNIIAVASCNQNATNISNWSNYGKTTVDFFAKGEGIDFLQTSIQGTSFASPSVAAKVAFFKNGIPNISNSSLLYNLNMIGITKPPSFNNSKLVKYDKIINP